jgi:hypothetical protein
MIPPVRDLLPLNQAGRDLTMEDFLDICNFDKDDQVPRVLIGITLIRHWEFFFRNTDIIQLQRMGFPYPIASQLMNGAELLGATHTQTADRTGGQAEDGPGPSSYQGSPEY